MVLVVFETTESVQSQRTIGIGKHAVRIVLEQFNRERVSHGVNVEIPTGVRNEVVDTYATPSGRGCARKPLVEAF